MELYLSAKQIEGCSYRTINYYSSTLVNMFNVIDLPVRKITTEAVREYLKVYQAKNNCGKVTVNNVRRNLSSFFSWLEEENYSWDLHTNGSGKKQSWWQELYDCYETKYNKIWFGVDGLADTAHNYRVGINWQQSFDAMCLGVKQGKDIYWQWIPFSFNEHQIDDAKKLATDNGINLVLRLSARWDKNDPLMPSPKWLPTEGHDGNIKEML